MIEFERGPQKINLNTYVLVGGFIITLTTIVFGGGMALSEVKGGVANNTTSIDNLRSRVSTFDSVHRIVDNHELRLTTVEKQVLDSLAGIRTVENSMNQLSSDIRVVREILQRLESKTDARATP